MKTIFLFAAVAAFSLNAAEIKCAGILGNSGEQGSTLVRFSERSASGMGIVCDKYGTLWDRGGEGVLNRYALDGRLIASYMIPAGQDGNIAISGDTVIVRVDGGLHSIPVDAPAGTRAKPMNMRADFMSPSTNAGWVAVSIGVTVFLVNEAGERKPAGVFRKAPDLGIEFGPDGKIYAAQSGKLFRLDSAPEGVTLAGPLPGERPQFMNGFWYGHSHHSTIRRFDAALQPAPGVVMGGNSGAFIGHVDEQAEVVDGRGLAQAGPNLYAVSGASGIVHLLEWKPLAVRFEPMRRIGAVANCNALALDREGRVWFRSGNWNWNDSPATPLHYGVPEPEKIFGLTTTDSDSVAGFGEMWGKPMISSGKFDKEVRLMRIESQTMLPKDAAAIALIEQNKKPAMLIIDKRGAAMSVYLGDDGKYLSDGGAVQINTTTPVSEWTSLQSLGAGKLLGAADGFVIELTRDGANWKESKRWNSFGPSPTQAFGKKIFLTSDGARLWIADSMRHRIVCVSQDKHEAIAEFGECDKPGDDLTHLSTPQVISARGMRAVVFDAANQRLVKLALTK